MPHERNDTYLELEKLCRQISAETDRDKMLDLIAEIDAILDHHLNATIQALSPKIQASQMMPSPDGDRAIKRE
jgi:hypothetical protein